MNEDKLFKCDENSRDKFKEFLLKNNYATQVTLLPDTDYQDVMFIDKKNIEHYVEIKHRDIKYLKYDDLYLEEKKYNNLLRIAGSYGYIINFFGEDMSKLMIHNYSQYKDARMEYFTASKYTVKYSEAQLKEVRCIEAKKGSFFIYDKILQNYKKVDYDTFIQ